MIIEPLLNKALVGRFLTARDRLFRAARPGARRALAVLLLLIGAALTDAAQGGETITWVVTDWPPLFILKDGHVPQSASDLGDGSTDRVLRDVIERLPGFTHRFEILNTARLWGGIKAGQDLCYSAALRTPERLRLAYMTPYVPLPAVAVIARHGKLSAMANPDGSISLAKLIAADGLHGVIEPLRSYGAGIDSMIAVTPNSNLSVETLERDGRALRLIDAGRMDYIVEYPFVVQYQLRHLDTVPDMDFYNIVEMRDEPIGYFACTRDEWGKRVIAAIDQAIREVSVDPRVRTATTNWLPARIRAAEQQRTDRFYDARAAGHSEIE